jgi:C-terminal processing protease CtpA/Prc
MSDSDGPLHSPHRKTTTASDDLTSVTVRKESLNEKSGIFLVERQGVVYVTKIAENGLFHNTEIDVGDVVLSINGKRLKKGEGSGDFIKTITQAKATVTVVVKKLGKKPTRGARSLSPRTRRKKKTGERRYTGLARRNQDGSLNSSLSPIVSAYNSDDDEDVFEQYHITGTKIFANQDAGLAFQEDDNMLFVSKIALDSIFRDTELEVGDRVCLINQMNFMVSPSVKDVFN